MTALSPAVPQEGDRDRGGAAKPRAESLRRWLRRQVRAVTLMLLATAAWAFFLGNARRPYFGMRLTSINNRTPTTLDQWRFFGEDWAINTCVALAVLVALSACTRWRFRGPLYGCCLLAVGTPAAWLTGVRAQAFVSTPGTSTVDWEGLTPLVGVAGAWLAFLGATAWLEFYSVSVRVIRRADAGRSRCPLCRFDLAASTSGVCPECGWTIPAALRIKTPSAASSSPAAGPAPSTP